MKLRTAFCSALALAFVLSASLSAHAANGMKKGTPELQSAGPLAFGPQGILLVGDPKGAAIFAIDTGDSSGNPAKAMINVEGIEAKAAQAVKANKAQIADIAVNPLSGNVYLSVNSSGPDQSASIVKVDTKGNVSEFSLKDVSYSMAKLADAPEDKEVQGRRGPTNPRHRSITDLAFMDGQVLVSGLSSQGPASTIRTLSFPFSEADPGTALEIYHGAHGKMEDNSSLGTFVPFNINGEPSVLAAYTCTPLVKFPVKDIVANKGEKLRGTTLAELGNRNQPLDMIVYKKDGKEFLLVANSARGVMKVSTDNIGKNEGITERVADTAGQPYVTVKEWEGVTQLDKLNDTHAVVLADGNLQTVELP